MPRQHTYVPHAQLKKIRGILGITQMKLAATLGVSYPYLLSVETGQRDMSEQLARKISWLVGVPSNQLRKKAAAPMAWDHAAKTFIPFSKKTFEQHKTKLPTFSPDPNDPSEQVTPTLKEYAQAFHAMLECAQKQGRLGALLQGFFELFAENFYTTDAIDAFMESDRVINGRARGDGRAALIGYVYDKASLRPEKRKRVAKRKGT